MTQILVETSNPIDVDSVLINKNDLDDEVPPVGRVFCEHGVVSEREPIVRRRPMFRGAARYGSSRGAYRGWHRPNLTLLAHVDPLFGAANLLTNLAAPDRGAMRAFEGTA